MHKTLHNLSTNLILDILKVKYSDYNLLGGIKFICDNIQTVNYGSETISFYGPKIWEQVPDDTKNSESLQTLYIENLHFYLNLGVI